MSKPMIKFIYDLPYKARMELCNILDYNNDWKTLGGIYMKFDVYDLHQMDYAIQRRGSPTDELLSRWGSQNHTVLELYKHLHEMKHFRAMLILKPFVASNYHKCIPEGSSDIKTKTTPSEESSVLTEATHRSAQPNGRVNFQHEASVKQENNPGNQPTRKVSDTVTPTNVLGGTPHIPYEELTIATNNWNKLNILGRGGFGTVYKGFWKNTPIAVKKLEVQRSNNMSEGTVNQCQREQSLRELKYLNSCRHDNILPLYGISFESGKYCLIYQFMPNGSLEDRLLLRKNTPALPWAERLNIAKGTALGIQFLHSREPPLIHGDIKSANILLNSHMDPVIGDFGLTQEGPIEKATHITLKRVSGTRPYLPPEFLSGKRISTKVDVYAFGIVLYEIATGLRAYDDTRRSERHLKNLVDKQPEDNMYDLVDKNAQPIDLKTAYKFINIGKLSTKMLPRERPEMVQVYHELSGGETPNATGPSLRRIPSNFDPTSSGTPAVRIFPPNGHPRFKFGVPHVPTLGQSPLLLQQTGSQVNEIIRFPPQHLSPNNARPQDILLHQGLRSGSPIETPKPNVVKHAEIPPPQQQASTAPPQQQASTAPPQQQASTAPPQQQASTAPPQQASTAPPQQASTAPPQQQASTAPPPQQASTAPPQQQASTAPPQQQASTAPPQQQASTAPPQQQASTAPPQQQASTAPPQQQASTAPPPQQASTAPPQQASTAPPPIPDKINAESNKTQSNTSEENCSSCHLSHSTSESEESVEILNQKSQLPSVIQNNPANTENYKNVIQNNKVDVVPAESTPFFIVQNMKK